MTAPSAPAPPRAVVSAWPPLFVLAVALALLWWAQSYSPVARSFPSAVAAILAVLAVFDLWSRLPLPGRALVEGFWGTSFARREMMHDPALRDEGVMAAWVLAAFAGMALLGTLVALPVFCLVYAWRRGGRPLRQAAIVALALLVFEYVVFEWLLDYTLYRGLLFTTGGFRRW